MNAWRWGAILLLVGFIGLIASGLIALGGHLSLDAPMSVEDIGGLILLYISIISAFVFGLVLVVGAGMMLSVWITSRWGGMNDDVLQPPDDTNDVSEE
jgi:hypothetical protein